MYQSLSRYTDNFVLYVLCLDAQTYQILNQMQCPKMILVPLSDLEKADPELLSVKNSRSKIEYYFTCTASFGYYIFNQYQNVKFLTYLDADTYFFSTPIYFLDILQGASIAITPHRFPTTKKDHEKYGVYNVGWVSFKRDYNGMCCLEDWRTDCLNWCHAYLEGDRFGDQKYLDAWPTRYENVKIIDHFGVNAGPWNLECASLTLEKDCILINNEPLILYHFHSLSRLINRVYCLGLCEYSVEINPILRRRIYSHYIHQVKITHNKLQNRTLPRFGMPTKKFSYRNFLSPRDILCV